MSLYFSSAALATSGSISIALAGTSPAFFGFYWIRSIERYTAVIQRLSTLGLESMKGCRVASPTLTQVGVYLGGFYQHSLRALQDLLG